MKLSPAEQSVVSLYRSGWSLRAIAKWRGVTPGTVYRQWAAIKRKLPTAPARFDGRRTKLIKGKLVKS